MNATKARSLTKDEIQRTRNAIRSSWSPGQREQRRKQATTRQQWLWSELLLPAAAALRRVA